MVFLLTSTLPRPLESCHLTSRFFYLALVLALLPVTHAAAKRAPSEPATYRSSPAAMSAANAMAERLKVRPAWVRGVIGKARRLPAVVKAVTPGQASAARDWSLYRSRVVEPRHIAAGVRFWQHNAETLARAEVQTGVSASTIVGILGVETIYGQHMGGYRTLDALSTLAFDFPAAHPKAAQRAAYFLQELEEFLRLCKAQGLDPLKVRGSYAGALGIAQFMPSSWRQYAVDFDGDGRIDLFGSRADAIGSVANYLAAFHWKAGMATHYLARPAAKRHRAQPEPGGDAGKRRGAGRQRCAPPRLAGADRAAQWKRAHPVRGGHRQFLHRDALQLEQLLRHGRNRARPGSASRLRARSGFAPRPGAALRRP